MNLRDEAIRAMANGAWYGRDKGLTIEQIAAETQAQGGAKCIQDDTAAALDGLIGWLRDNAALLVSDPLSLHLDSDLGEAALDGGIQFHGSIIEPEAREPFLTPSHLADLLEDSDGPQ